MAKLRLMVALMIGVLQVSHVCKANPVTVGEVTDVGKLFSASELQRAKNARIADGTLIRAKSYGFSFEETIKFQELRKVPKMDGTDVSIDFSTRICTILVPEFRPAASYSKAQQLILNELSKSLDQLATVDELLFIRTSICAYLSQPFLYETDAKSFRLQLVPYMIFRFLKLKNGNVSGVERVHVAKKLCCVYQGLDNSSDLMNALTFNALPDGDLSEFNERWNEFETTNTSKSFEKICDLLSRFKNPSYDCGFVQ